MSTRPQIHRTRPAVAVLASGLTLCLTALTAGVAPAPAAPHDDPATPTTTIEVPEPEPSPTRATLAPSVPAPTPPPASTPTPTPTPVPAEPATAAPATDPPAHATAPPTATEPVTTEPVTTEPAAPTTPTVAATTGAAPAPSPQHRATSATPTPPSSAVVTTTAVPTTTPPAQEVVETPTSTTESAPAEPTPSTTAASSTTSTVAAAAETTESVTSATAELRAIETLRPQTMRAAPADVELAKAAPPIEQKPVAATRPDVVALASSIRTFDRHDTPARQWDRDWVRYDEYYRPVLSNPYRDPVRIIYEYQNARRIAVIPPLGSIVLDVLQLAAYSFTAVVVNAVNTVVSVAVGSFFGGGYVPVLGQALPAPPPPVLRYDNVPVQVRYRDAVYQPFRVQRILDVGDDARYGERKVLLDGVTPAWGNWIQTPSGERQFEVHKTQQYPGLDDPQQVPLPGDYRLKLVAGDKAGAPNHRGAYLAAAGLTCAGLSVAALIGSALLGRRRRAH